MELWLRTHLVQLWFGCLFCFFSPAKTEGRVSCITQRLALLLAKNGKRPDSLVNKTCSDCLLSLCWAPHLGPCIFLTPSMCVFKNHQVPHLPSLLYAFPCPLAHRCKRSCHLRHTLCHCGFGVWFFSLLLIYTWCGVLVVGKFFQIASIHRGMCTS